MIAKIVSANSISTQNITQSIRVLRGQKVMLDMELATLYGVSVSALLQAMKRNPSRFPDDFMFQLSADEWQNLRSQIVISSLGHGGRRFLPYAFTEQGVAMLSSVLRSDRAVAVNVEIMRAFVRMRALIASNEELSQRLDELELRIGSRLDAHDEAIAAILSAIRELMAVPPTRAIGFTADLDRAI